MFPKPKENEKAKQIEQIDIKSYYVKGSEKEPYLVYNSDSKGWMCDCIWWSIHMKDCKHIVLVKKTYNL